ncbi:R-spondin-3 [Anolis carolinensis]|uniref:R-spondin 3 n=1 Tax=Anolis carolinensis TaxID=28377 RepID=A0A803T2G0_ANOCA|nr:PREDICTED: R-spondin-3 [Anolis carolinensis]|eukprot:XP_008120556.1 PREDICTED: R-spondin-3 [Anolis carolinensis]
MQLRLVSWVFIAWNLMESVGSRQPASRVRRQGKMHHNMSRDCPVGCATCSEYNGCMTCNPRLFFHLERRDIKQIGVCVSSCPPGHVGQRSPERNECIKCKDDCEACFNKNFCMKCKNGFYLHHGKCLENCPDWLEPNNHTMECNNIVHCRVHEWSEWSPCTRRGKVCGFRRGNETRVREIIQLPSIRGKLCPHTSETRKCVVQRKKCPREPGRRKERRKKPKRGESKETSQENRGREARRQNRERENKSKTQPKKRRTQDKPQKLAPISTAH